MPRRPTVSCSTSASPPFAEPRCGQRLTQQTWHQSEFSRSQVSPTEDLLTRCRRGGVCARVSCSRSRQNDAGKRVDCQGVDCPLHCSRVGVSRADRLLTGPLRAVRRRCGQSDDSGGQPSGSHQMDLSETVECPMEDHFVVDRLQSRTTPKRDPSEFGFYSLILPVIDCPEHCRLGQHGSR